MHARRDFFMRLLEDYFGLSAAAISQRHKPDMCSVSVGLNYEVGQQVSVEVAQLVCCSGEVDS
jgi:hypothetical protein